MKTALFLTLIVAVTTIAASSQVEYATYTNPRFGYSIEYPTSLLNMRPAPENDDGRTFRSRDNMSEMRVWGQYNALFETLDSIYASAIKRLDGKPTYSKVDERSYVFSGYKKGKIYYERMLIKSATDGDTFVTFTIEYPKAQRAKWDPVVTRISRSLKLL